MHANDTTHSDPAAHLITHIPVMNYTLKYGNIVILIIIIIIICTKENFRLDRGNTEKMKIVRFYRRGGKEECVRDYLSYDGKINVFLFQSTLVRLLISRCKLKPNS